MSGMQIFVQAYGGSFITLDVESSDSVENVRTKVQDKLGTPPDVQELLLAGRALDDGYTLADYNVQKEATIQLVPRKGVVTYEAVYESPPPLGGDQMAYLAVGSELSQDLVGITGGLTYELGFYARGTLDWKIEFFDASTASVGTSSGNVVADPPGLSPSTLAVVAPGTATKATISFTASSRSVLLDLVSFRTS